MKGSTVMRKIVLILTLLSIAVIYAQDNTAPVVSNVTFSQRTDGSFMVDVYYDVNDADNNTMDVTMQVSDDAGTSWNLSCVQISGDAGTGIISGTDKHIVWDFGAKHPQTFPVAS